MEITPKTNTALYGHADAEATLLGDLKTGKLAHGFLLSGPRGIGKATLAYRFARALLSGEEPSAIGEEHPIFKRIIAGSHADLMVLENLYDEKKEEYAREISVDQARGVSQFLSLTPGEGQWRLVIIDAADALNSNAANAILKILEEPPPQALLILISHNPGRLLPTIRSRCRTMRLNPLTRDQFTKVMRHIAPQTEQMKALAALSDNSPGVALELQELQAFDLYEELLSLLTNLPVLNAMEVHKFSEAIGTGKVHANWQLLTRLLLCLFDRATKQGAGVKLDPISETESAVLVRLASLHPAGQLAAKWQQCAEQFSLAERLHLDYKQVIIAFLHSIAGRDSFDLGSAAA